MRATSTLERLFIEMEGWNDNKEGDKMVAQRALVSIIRVFKEEVETLL